MELMIVLALVFLLATFALPGYQGYIDRARTSQAIGEMGRISLEIDKFRLSNNDSLPLSLADLSLETLEDPWGNNYEYLDITLEVGKGNLRKDKNLNPLNTDYDLYSRGPDGQTKKPLQPKVSHDDIIRANNGGYVGIAENY